MKLDVGCGSKPTGDVNTDIFRGGRNVQEDDQVIGLIMDPHLINTFVIADSCHLPFRDDVFSEVFSSHCIEHVVKPQLMLKELCRVSSCSVTVRCPHRRGSGAKRPFHINYLDEEWFCKTADSLKLDCFTHVIVYDYPISNRVKLLLIFKDTLIWRVLRHLERRFLNNLCKIPFELEVKILK